ncbi:hypothetical protein V8C42DRAFT_175730 [Trichoderma barbatum]
MPNNVNFRTSQQDIEPGDTTGDYYITFCNLPFHSTWQEVKDWVSAQCPVDFVEVFPISCSGWLRLRGKDNFMKASAYMQSERFKDRVLLIDGRNETEAVKIRVKETKPTPGGSNRRSSLTGGNRGRRMASRQTQTPHQASTPRRRRTRSLTRSETDAIDMTDIMARLADDDFLAVAHFMLSMSLQSTLQMQHYALPHLCSFYNGVPYTMESVNDFPYYYGGYNQAGAPFDSPGNAGDDARTWMDDEQD